MDLTEEPAQCLLCISGRGAWLVFSLQAQHTPPLIGQLKGSCGSALIYALENKYEEKYWSQFALVVRAHGLCASSLRWPAARRPLHAGSRGQPGLKPPASSPRTGRRTHFVTGISSFVLTCQGCTSSWRMFSLHRQ